jgi:hypothetical protein
MNDHKRLPRPYQSILAAFLDAGGSGDLDIHGRVTIGSGRHPMQGDTVAWLRLVAEGLVAGEDGKMILTEDGRAMANAIINGRTTVSA